MPDISTVWSRDMASGDWSIAGADLQSGGNLATGILISVFTDREANPDDVIPDGSEDPRGWIGDLGEDYKLGSRIWLLSRAKQSTETLQRANDYLAEALQWMVDDGVVGRFDITTEWNQRGFLAARIITYENNGSTIAMGFEWVWKELS